MNVEQKNELLARGEIDREDMWPRIVEFESKALTFPFEFGLDELPVEPGLIVPRGPFMDSSLFTALTPLFVSAPL